MVFNLSCRLKKKSEVSMIHHFHSPTNIYQIFSGSSKSWQALSFFNGTQGYCASSPKPHTELCQERKLWVVTPTSEGYVNHYMTVYVSYQSHRHFINLSSYPSFLTMLIISPFLYHAYNTPILMIPS